MAKRMVPARLIVREISPDDCVELVYPSSKTGEDTPRRGRVEKVDGEKSLLTVEIDPPDSGEYRSFKFSRISGGIVTVVTDDEDTPPERDDPF